MARANYKYGQVVQDEADCDCDYDCGYGGGGDAVPGACLCI